ncbi:MAG TPA: hypothetical protein VKU01_29580 [Bryobacteraceae bacterium]|nr:hypothetical protein [Bryobacteraceae bacterium]
MLHSLLITQNKEAAELFTSLIRSSGQINLDRVFCPPPSPYQLTMALTTLALDVAFIDVTDREQAVATCEQIRDKKMGLATVGFSTATGSECPKHATPFTLDFPLSVQSFSMTVRDAIHAARPKRRGNVYAIMPGKAGGGATTIVLNLASHLANTPDTRVVVVEGDLHSGTIKERLELKLQQSIAQTLASADVAETLIWPRHVARKANIDFILTGRERGLRSPEWHSYHHLLTFLSNRYDHVLVDLPELLDDDTAEVAQTATTVFVMTTPEILSLHLAHQRIEELKAFGVLASRIKLLINRWHSDDMTPPEIAGLLDCEVGGVFPNDYRAVTNATLEKGFVDPHTRLGKAYRACASAIAGHNLPIRGPEGRRSLLELLRPARQAAASSH